MPETISAKDVAVIVVGRLKDLDAICKEKGGKNQRECDNVKKTQIEDRYTLLYDLGDLMRNLLNEENPDKHYAFWHLLYIKNECLFFLHKDKGNKRFSNLYYRCLLTESPYLLESYIEYLEKKRPMAKKFYEPRKEQLHKVAMALQRLEDDPDAKFLGVSLPARTGKSTLCIFFLTWIMCKRPNSHSAMGGHSGILAKGFYKEVLNIITTSEYTFQELYAYMHPNHMCLRDKSAEEFTINLDAPDRFATLTCRGIDGTWTGAVDISGSNGSANGAGYLYIDDLVRDREHSLSPTRMETTWQEYLNKCVDRKNTGAKELMVGTLWNVYDPLERMRKKYEGQKGYEFVKIPALNEKDESNFNYKINGFTTEYYKEIRDRLDNAEWQAKYQQEPFVREGLLYESNSLRYFNGILPDGDHRIVAVVDVAWGGGDSLSMPIGAEYANGDVYIFDWVFNRGTKEETLPLVVGQIINNEIREIRFEGNTGGDLYCQYVDERLQQNHYKCSCTSKKAPTKMAKVEKIIAYSGDVKRKFIFLSPKRPTESELDNDKRYGNKRYLRSAEYQRAMDELHMFVTIGDNEHDDAPDGLTQLAMFLENNGVAKVEAVRNPFSYGIGGYYR